MSKVPQIEPPARIAGTLGALIGGAVGYSLIAALLGLFVELGMTRKFEGRIFLYVALAMMLLPWLVEHLPKG